jgi:hypothetical protein
MIKTKKRRKDALSENNALEDLKQNRGTFRQALPENHRLLFRTVHTTLWRKIIHILKTHMPCVTWWTHQDHQDRINPEQDDVSFPSFHMFAHNGISILKIYVPESHFDALNPSGEPWTGHFDTESLDHALPNYTQVTSMPIEWHAHGTRPVGILRYSNGISTIHEIEQSPDIVSTHVDTVNLTIGTTSESIKQCLSYLKDVEDSIHLTYHANLSGFRLSFKRGHVERTHMIYIQNKEETQEMKLNHYDTFSIELNKSICQILHTMTTIPCKRMVWGILMNTPKRCRTCGDLLDPEEEEEDEDEDEDEEEQDNKEEKKKPCCQTTLNEVREPADNIRMDFYMEGNVLIRWWFAAKA